MILLIEILLVAVVAYEFLRVIAKIVSVDPYSKSIED